jgi:hypothetical protein
MKRHLREPALEMLRDYIQSHCKELDPTEAIRAAADAIQVGIGQQMLRDLRTTRAYHYTSGDLGDNELLIAGAVEKMIRRLTGMQDEPAQPVERQVRRGLRR